MPQDYALQFSGEPITEVLESVPNNYQEGGVQYTGLSPEGEETIRFRMGQEEINRRVRRREVFNVETRIFNDEGTTLVCTATYYPEDEKAHIFCDADGNKLYDTMLRFFSNPNNRSESFGS